MKTMRLLKTGIPRHENGRTSRRPGFTLTELVVGGSIMMVLVLITLTLYAKSNKVSVDQGGYAEMQHDVRSSMYLVTKDVRMAGIGLPQEFIGSFIEGMDNDATDAAANVRPDRLTLVGNIEYPASLKIRSYQGASANVTLDDYSFEQNPYTDSFYNYKIAIVVPNPSSTCRVVEFREITGVAHDTGATNEKLNFSPGEAPGINPPGGLKGTCSSSSDYDGGWVLLGNVKEYWLDVTGHYPGLTSGQNGYIGNGNGNILYCKDNFVNYPLAQNIENLQFQYNGDLDNNGSLDGFQDWNINWSKDQIGRIRLVRAWVLGKTKNKFVSISGSPPGGIHLYRRPAVANTAAAAADDMCRRFLLDSTASVRNMNLNLYYLGER
jgi:hypothetical protein